MGIWVNFSLQFIRGKMGICRNGNLQNQISRKRTKRESNFGFWRKYKQNDNESKKTNFYNTDSIGGTTCDKYCMFNRKFYICYSNIINSKLIKISKSIIYFINNDLLNDFVDNKATQWYDIIAGFAAFLGVLNLVRLHSNKISYK